MFRVWDCMRVLGSRRKFCSRAGHYREGVARTFVHSTVVFIIMIILAVKMHMLIMMTIRILLMI